MKIDDSATWHRQVTRPGAAAQGYCFQSQIGLLKGAVSDGTATDLSPNGSDSMSGISRKFLVLIRVGTLLPVIRWRPRLIRSTGHEKIV